MKRPYQVRNAATGRIATVQATTHRNAAAVYSQENRRATPKGTELHVKERGADPSTWQAFRIYK